MKTGNPLIRTARQCVVTALCITAMNYAIAGTLPSTIDEFSDPQESSLGIGRLFLDDTSKALAVDKTRTVIISTVSIDDTPIA